MIKMFFTSGLMATGILTIPFLVGALIFAPSLMYIFIVFGAALIYFVVFSALPLYLWFKMFEYLRNVNKESFPVFTSGFYVLFISEVVVLIGGYLISQLMNSNYMFSEIASVVLFFVPGYIATGVILQCKLKNITKTRNGHV